MSQEAFKYVLDRGEYTKIDASNLEDAKYMLETCFGKDSQLRKDLLIDFDETSVSSAAATKRRASNKSKSAATPKKKVAKKVAKKTVKKVTKKKVTTKKK